MTTFLQVQEMNCAKTKRLVPSIAGSCHWISAQPSPTPELLLTFKFRAAILTPACVTLTFVGMLKGTTGIVEKK